MPSANRKIRVSNINASVEVNRGGLVKTLGLSCVDVSVESGIQQIRPRLSVLVFVDPLTMFTRCSKCCLALRVCSTSSTIHVKRLWMLFLS